MAFAVVCKSCHSRFLLNDDLLKRRVAGRVVTVRCRQCHAAIEIDASQVGGTATEPDSASAEPAGAERDIAGDVEPVAPRPHAFKPAPHPPRPAKSSTLMGIGAPARPPGSTELVALSPGLLNVGQDHQASPLDFPEPPPPPAPPSLEELNADDWEIAETPPVPTADAAPESVDDFIEELPPSIPPPADEEPTALMPIKQLLKTPKVPNLAVGPSAAAGGTSAASEPETPRDGAPLADIAGMAAHASTANPKSTLPLFGLDESHAATFPSPPKAPSKPRPPQPSASAAEGSLSPAALDPPPSVERPDSARTRKNVVAPATNSVPPERKRSPLSIPIVGALALAAGFLIWKRGAVTEPSPAAQSVQPSIAAAQPAEPVLEANEPAALAPAPSAPAPADDITFEAAPTPTQPKAAPAAHHEPSAASTSDAPLRSTKPDAPAPASKPAEPASVEAPVAKAEPKPDAAEPATPSGPVGDFDPSAAAAALTAGAAQASACRREGDPSGVASVVITFAPSGRVTSANVSGPPFAGTPTGGCIAAALRKARVPPFEGDRVTVSKTIVIQ